MAIGLLLEKIFSLSSQRIWSFDIDLPISLGAITHNMSSFCSYKIPDIAFNKQDHDLFARFFFQQKKMFLIFFFSKRLSETEL